MYVTQLRVDVLYNNIMYSNGEKSGHNLCIVGRAPHTLRLDQFNCTWTACIAVVWKTYIFCVWHCVSCCNLQFSHPLLVARSLAAFVALSCSLRCWPHVRLFSNDSEHSWNYLLSFYKDNNETSCILHLNLNGENFSSLANCSNKTDSIAEQI